MKKKLLIAILTLIISSFIIDFLLSKIIPQNCNVYQQDHLLRTSHIPKKSCVIKTGEYKISYQINSLGLRDNEIIVEKPINTLRILFLGDSFTEGLGVELKDSMVKILEDKLKTEYKDKKIQTINSGVAAYTTLNEYLYLINKGIFLNPDVVVVNLNMTDFNEEREFSKEIKKDQNGEFYFPSAERKTHLPSFIRNYLKDNSFIYRVFLKNEESLIKIKESLIAKISEKQIPSYAKSKTNFKIGDPDADIFAVTRDIPDEKFKELFNPVADELILIKMFLAGKNIPMVLSIIPNGHQIGASQWKAGRKALKLMNASYPRKIFDQLNEFGQKNDIPVVDGSLDLIHYLRDYPTASLFYDFDGHFTPLGQKIAADSIYKFLTSDSSPLNIGKQ